MSARKTDKHYSYRLVRVWPLWVAVVLFMLDHFTGAHLDASLAAALILASAVRCVERQPNGYDVNVDTTGWTVDEALWFVERLRSSLKADR